MKGKTIKLRFSRNFLFFLSKHGPALIFSVLLIVGVVLGVVCFSSKIEGLLPLLEAASKNYLIARCRLPFFSIFISSASFSIIFILFAFLSGLSLAGIPFLALLSFGRGFFLGTLGGYLLSLDPLKGFIFYLSIVLLPSIIAVFALVLGCRESFNFSSYLIKALSAQGKGRLIQDFKIYCVRYIFLLGIALFAAVADMLLSGFFAPYFSLL